MSDVMYNLFPKSILQTFINTLDQDTAARLIAHLWRGGQWGYFWRGQDKRSHWIGTGAPLPDLTGRYDYYFGLHPTAGKPKNSTHKRSLRRTVCAVNTLFGEFDAKDFEGGLSAALDHIRSLPLQPSVIVFSGGGYHCYWLLRDTFFIETDPQRDQIDRLQKRWVDRIGSDPGAKDLTRMLRVPGTRNYKEKYAPDYPLVTTVHADFDCLYDLADFEAQLPPDEQPERKPVAPPQTQKGQNQARRWAATYASQKLDELAAASMGERNRKLYNTAFVLGQLVQVGLLEMGDVQSGLLTTGRGIGLDERETAATVASGIKDGLIVWPDWLPDFDTHPVTKSDPTPPDDFFGSMADFIQQTFGHLPPLPVSKTDPEPDYDRLLASPRDPNARTRRWHYTAELEQRLLDILTATDDRGRPLYGKPKDIQQIVMGLRTVAGDETNGGEMGRLWTKNDFMEMGHTKHTAQAILDTLTRAGIYAEKHLRELDTQDHQGVFRINSAGKRGRPVEKAYMLRDPDVAIDYLVATLTENAIRVDQYAPPGERQFIPDELRQSAPYTLDYDEVQRANAARRPLLDAHDQQRQRSERQIAGAAQLLKRELMAAVNPRFDPPVPLPDDKPIRNKTDFLAARERAARELDGEIVFETQQERMRAVGASSPAQLRRIREINQRVTVPTYKSYVIRRGESIVDRVPDYALTRAAYQNWGLHLEADNGETFKVTGYACLRDTNGDLNPRQIDDWVARQYALGATRVVAKVQKKSIERPATVEEITVIEERQAERKARAAEYRAARKEQVPPPAPRAAAPEETPINEHPEFYARKQAVFGLADHTDYELRTETLVNRATGEEWPAPTVQMLCQAWAGTLKGGIQGLPGPSSTGLGEVAGRPNRVALNRCEHCGGELYLVRRDRVGVLERAIVQCVNGHTFQRHRFAKSGRTATAP